MGKFPGVETHKLSKCPGVGTKKEGKCPAPGIEIAVFTSMIVFDKRNIVHLVAVKNQDILNDDESHFKLARFVLKIAYHLNSRTFCILTP